MLSFDLQGVESIQRDFDEFNRDVGIAANYGLKTVASELAPALQRHIRKDVYEAYTPQRYERRFDNPQYGRSLNDIGNMNWNLTRNGGMESVEFTYEPNGRNAHYPSARYWGDGDTIIDVLQNDRGYLWRNMDGIGKERRFWDNFVDEVIKESDKWFISGFNGYSRDLRAVKDGNVIREESDYQLDPIYEVKRS